MQKKSITSLFHIERFRRSCSTERTVIWNDEFVLDRRACSNATSASKKTKTRGDMLYLLKHSARHYRGGQEAGRTTDQTSLHHVHPWSSQSSIEDYSNRSTSWKLCRITKTHESKRLLGVRKETKLRNDRGALTRNSIWKNSIE